MKKNELLIIVVGVIVLVMIIIGVYAVWFSNASQRNPTIHERIASLDPTCTQLLYSLGLGKDVVAMDEYSVQLLNYFNETPGNNVTILQSIWPFPSLESILNSTPTAICYDYGWYGPQLSKLAGYNWTIVIINGTSDSNMSQIDNDILKAGEELGSYSNAREVVNGINAILASINSTTASLSRPTVIYLDGVNPIYSASFNTFIGYEIKAANGIDVVNTTYPWPQLSVSQFLLYNADYIIASDFMGNCSATLQAILSLPGVNSIKAVRENHVFIIGNLGQSLVEEPGPLSVYGVKLIAYIIHPQAFGVNPPHCINATWIMNYIRPEMSIG
ncbi:ABC transporter substrate-binding protein [Thermocladium modestius]|uniref:ABC transporter substrate-binding protein n=1 Tax=Thermocladium modestius TaxID=62609 RepID=A0A830GW26_9CREN|nr:ABC transporter substrate-binding protein [Thermocladium modestius]GGP20426.1 ABC transporter substrate-binding protein [Thermocladium modestius]